MKRITDKDLNDIVQSINEATGHPHGARHEGKRVAGAYMLDQAYGGNKLMRVCPNGRGIENPIGCAGFDTKRKCLELMTSFLYGLGA